MSESVYQLKVTLHGIKPLIWRRLRVPGGIDLLSLHHAIQIAFGWTDSHLHQFTIGRAVYAMDEDGGYSGADGREDETSLEQIAKAKSKLRYEYDFGDSWQHDIVVERVEAGSPDEPAVACVAGKRAGPEEDSGGPWGYMDKLKAFANETHEDHADIRDWFGDDFDPKAFDIDRVNARLAKAFRLPKKKTQKKTKTKKKALPFSPSLH